MNIGTLLRQIRKNKGLTLAQVADATISSSYLSKVERGQNDITVTKLLHLLERLETTPEEFLYIAADDFDMDYSNLDRMLETYFGSSLTMSANPQDFPETLRKMKENVRQAQTRFQQTPTLKNKLAVNARMLLPVFFQSLVIDEAHKLPVRPDLTHVAEQYLQQLDNWGELDLYLFIIFSIAMPAETQHRLLTIAIKRSHHYRHFRSAPLLILNLLENQVMLELPRQDNQAAARYLSQLETALDKKPSAEFALWAQFHRAELCARQGQHKKARALLDQVVEIAAALKFKDLADIFAFARTIILTEPPTSIYKYFHILVGSIAEGE